MLRVLKEVFNGKATISDPDAFKDKIRLMERADRNNLRRIKSSTSFSTLYSKSNYTTS